MNRENEMKSRKEAQMRTKKEGVAPAKDTTPSGKWLPATKPYTSLAEQEDAGGLTLKQALVSAAVVGVLLFCFMWLAAAF